MPTTLNTTDMPQNLMLTAFARFKDRYDAEEIKPVLWNLFKAAVTADDLSTDQRMDLATTYEDLCNFFEQMYPAFERESVVADLTRTLENLSDLQAAEKELINQNAPAQQNQSSELDDMLDELLEDMVSDESPIQSVCEKQGRAAKKSKGGGKIDYKKMIDDCNRQIKALKGDINSAHK